MAWRAETGSPQGIRHRGSQGSMPPATGGRGPVLIVEDDAASAELLSAVLEDEGFQPVVCADARDAMGPFQRLGPVAVFIDWVIPGGSGIELCRSIRAQDPVVPILFVTGRTDEASV